MVKVEKQTQVKYYMADMQNQAPNQAPENETDEEKKERERREREREQGGGEGQSKGGGNDRS